MPIYDRFSAPYILYLSFKQKYLSRKIPYASNGSFNPYIITNKEAHIMYLLTEWEGRTGKYLARVPNVWLHSSVDIRRASHRYRGGHGLESRWSLDFFRFLLSNCLNWKSYCDDHSSL